MIFFLLLLPLTLFAQTVCLNMIVKDETAVIRRCLETVKPIIDYWVIVDTGSKDGTQEMIQDFMKEIPGELHERPWKNFEHNRNEALSLAKGKADYLVFIDADEVFEYDPDFKLPELKDDFYHVTTRFNGTHYSRVQFVKDSLPWKWTGVLHEAIDCPFARSSSLIKGMYDVVRTDGARSQDPKKFEKDVAVLEEALQKEPNNTRYVFYLAQSHRDAGQHEQALKAYEKRIQMGGWPEEIYISYFYSAFLKELLNYPKDEVIASYLKAFEYRPTRAEPLCRLAEYHRKAGRYVEGYVAAKAALTIPVPNDLLFVEHWVYEYGALLECSICAYWIGKHQECHDQTLQYLALKAIPEPVRTCGEQNLAFAKEKLKIN